MITWRVINSSSNPLVIEIFQRHAWNYVTWPCTNALISAGNYMIGSGSLVCTAPCPPNISTLNSVAVPCTGYNIIEQYVSGENRFNIRVPSNYIFRAVFTSSAWFILVTGGSTWSVSTEINTYKRSNGRYNQAPIVTMLPIIRLRSNLTYYIKINVADNDFDRYTCIWSNSSQECGGVCRSLLTLPTSTYLNETSCILRFTPIIVGYYAIALTILDFENDTSTAYLSRVPIQFILRVWSSPNTCTTPPIYIGDVPADQCIFVEPGQSLTMLIRIKVQCANATLNNTIGVYPTGFTQSSTYLDPYDSTINVFQVTYVASANQVGQNLFCFAGVDSIGNQGDSTCLRFTVQISTDSRNTLYIDNATHFPIGLVPKSQSIWTLKYPEGITYNRPTTEAYIRFKLSSTQQDFLTYDVVKETSNVNYQTDCLVITTNVIFTPGESFFISLDPGVFLPISSCLRDSMGITDPTFWPFQIASEPSSTLTTSTTTQSSTTTILNRTVPTIRTLSTTHLLLTTKETTVVCTTSISLSTTIKTIVTPYVFPVSGIVGIIVGSLLIITILVIIIFQLRKRRNAKPTINPYPPPTKKHSLSGTLQQYFIKTRTNIQAARRSRNNTTYSALYTPDSTREILVDIDF
ncbi:unnamed protein product [Adineta steineri]|uniref:Uncharacterized protein n=1 Tax=Adineta steineri TaxID=433720 RepID=A0A814F7P4_9BILA|nr:unnamed protein product [Adineta steineri]CAF3503746.1 unnamed protein product [Adineta steineri]